MLKKRLETLYVRLEKTGMTEERDRRLIDLLREFESLPNDRKILVLPQLEKTLGLHEEIGESLVTIRKFLRSMDEAMEKSRTDGLKPGLHFH